MKIIKKPKKQTFNVKCECGCEYTYEKKDVKDLFDYRDKKTYYFVECPVCGCKEWVKKGGGK